MAAYVHTQRLVLSVSTLLHSYGHHCSMIWNLYSGPMCHYIPCHSVHRLFFPCCYWWLSIEDFPSRSSGHQIECSSRVPVSQYTFSKYLTSRISSSLVSLNAISFPF